MQYQKPDESVETNGPIISPFTPTAAVLEEENGKTAVVMVEGLSKEKVEMLLYELM